MERPACVLVVEDEPELREAMATTFRHQGHRVAAAADGQQALELLRDGHLPAVVVLDLLMPVLNGFQFLETARRDQRLRSVPVVAITSSEQDLPFGAQAIMRKPADMDALLEMIASHCAHAKARAPAYPP
jgi:CheY-like chemotaxis protein